MRAFSCIEWFIKVKETTKHSLPVYLSKFYMIFQMLNVSKNDMYTNLICTINPNFEILSTKLFKINVMMFDLYNSTNSYVLCCQLQNKRQRANF